MENQIVNAVANQVSNQVNQVATQTATGFFERMFGLYNQFIGMFPDKWQWIVSVLIILAVSAFLWNLIRKNWLWLILLVVLFPGLLPMLQNTFNSLSKLFIGK